MKKINILLASLGFTTTSILAALPAAQNPPLIDVPSLSGGWEIGVQGYDLQFTANNGLGDFLSAEFPFTIKNLDPGYEWGWGANISYIFPETGNDINLSYFHLGTDDTSSTNDNSISINFPVTFSFIGGTFISQSFFTTARAKEEFDLNQVDLTAGQYIDIGCRLILHPKTGIRFADIQNALNENYITNASGTGIDSILPGEGTTSVSASTIVHQESDYQGIGPLVGIDGSYYLGYGFGLVGHFDSALLIGNIDSKLNASIAWPTVPYSSANFFLPGLVSQNSFKADSDNRIVPNWNAKLGVDYTFLFNNDGNSDLTFEIGYQVNHYYNAVDVLNAIGTVQFGVVGPGAVTPSTFTFTPGIRRTADFGLQGPYASLTLHL